RYPVMNSIAFSGPCPGLSSCQRSQNCPMPSANSKANAIQTPLQIAASVMLTVWALRWKTPRSRMSIPRMKTWKPTRYQNSTDRPYGLARVQRTLAKLLLHNFFGLFVGQLGHAVLEFLGQVLDFVLA